MRNDAPELTGYEDDIWRDAHPECIQCEEAGCDAEECPSESCDAELLVVHEGELMHARCVEAFDRLVENRGMA